MIGNNCGHITENPRWFSPPEKHKRPKILTEMQTRLRRYYTNPALELPILCFINSKRQQRSERREACINVLACLIHYMDLSTLRVGIPQTDGSFKGIDMKFIAERCGLNLRRVERAMAVLVKSNIITVHTLCEKLSDTTYKGYAAIRTMSIELFSIFGLRQRLRHEREKSADRQKKKARKADAKANAQLKLAMKSLDKKLTADAHKGKVGRQELNSMKSTLNTS